MQDLERSYDTTLEAMGDALDLRDAETEGHSRRVTAYTVALAREMGMNADELRVIARGAFLHDIGKIATPDSVLLKPGRLDPAELAVMREHCERGYEMVRKIPLSARSQRDRLRPPGEFRRQRATPGGCAARRFRWARASSPLPTRWTPSPQTGRTARAAALKRR